MVYLQFVETLYWLEQKESAIVGQECGPRGAETATGCPTRVSSRHLADHVMRQACRDRDYKSGSSCPHGTTARLLLSSSASHVTGLHGGSANFESLAGLGFLSTLDKDPCVS